MSEPPIAKRRRVHKACESCRSLKAKCDGISPICGRCQGYGYVCVWAEGRNRVRTNDESTPRDRTTPLNDSSLRKAIQAYDKLVRSSCDGSSAVDRNAVETSLSYIRQHLPNDLLQSISASTPSGIESPQSQSGAKPEPHNDTTQRFLGESSDVRFFNAIKQILGNHGPTEENGEVQELESYEQYDRSLPQESNLPAFPTKAVADNYLHVYFATIHIAYPFICQPIFMQRYERLWNNDAELEADSSWLALLNTIFAIGTYYSSFPDPTKTERVLHGEFFQQALKYAARTANDSTLENICVLLAQCFYLLAICKTDQCWTTLGLAVRIGQSIGLHVEPAATSRPLASGASALNQEMRRRAWYSIYVLDRLLALQLGRPAAIHDQDYNRLLPNRMADTALDISTATFHTLSASEPSPGDYFVAVIKFSRTLGHVIRELYSPLQTSRSSEEMLRSTADLDTELLAWKASLPRVLRFDLGHTFEKSVTYRRQRNMLAMKFHNLRSMIHRPYLCLQCLRRNDPGSVALIQDHRDRVYDLEQICVSEARLTAHLLHNIEDKQSLVHDFPWWQMIPCLTCASSILLVARACGERFPDSVGPWTSKDYIDLLDEDADTCYKVFDALSNSSEAAKLARNMIERLRKTGTRGKPSGAGADAIQQPQQQAMPPPPYAVGAPNSAAETYQAWPAADFSGVAAAEPLLWGGDFDMQSNQLWPCEISDAMMWSSQFLQTSYDPFGNQQSL